MQCFAGVGETISGIWDTGKVSFARIIDTGEESSEVSLTLVKLSKTVIALPTDIVDIG
jgi:hypothetical protein